MLRYIIIFSFLLVIQGLFAQKSFEILSEERTVLLKAYEVKPKKTTRAKINRLERDILEHIQTNGYPVVVHTTKTLEVQDKAYPLKGNIIANLENQQEVLLLNKDSYGYYKIKVKDQIGYVYNLQTIPNLDNYPLHLINEELELQKIVDDLTNVPSVFRINNECWSVQCNANTPAGTSCKVQTRNCNGRCTLHN